MARSNDNCTVEEMYQRQFLRSAENTCSVLNKNSAMQAIKKIKAVKASIEAGAAGGDETNIQDIAVLIAGAHEIWHTHENTDRKFRITEKKAAAVSTGVKKMHSKFKGLEKNTALSKRKAYDATSSSEICRKSTEEVIRLEDGLKGVEALRRKLEATQLKEEDRAAELKRVEADVLEVKSVAEATMGISLGDYDPEELQRLLDEANEKKAQLSTRRDQMKEQVRASTQTFETLKAEMRGSHSEEVMQLPLDELKARAQKLRDSNEALQLEVEENRQQIVQKAELKDSKDQEVLRLRGENEELERQKDDRESRITEGTCEASRQLLGSSIHEIRQAEKDKQDARVRLQETIEQLTETYNGRQVVVCKAEDADWESVVEEDTVHNPLMTSTPVLTPPSPPAVAPSRPTASGPTASRVTTARTPNEDENQTVKRKKTKEVTTTSAKKPALTKRNKKS